VALVECTAAGDLRALLRLYEEMHRIIFTLIVRITKNRDVAAELTLDVFHDVWRRASTYEASSGSVVGWLMNQARCKAIERAAVHQRIDTMTGFDDRRYPQADPETGKEP
jgi:RNA polymerase sigma-70 factor, ECF subfamily